MPSRRHTPRSPEPLPEADGPDIFRAPTDEEIALRACTLYEPRHRDHDDWVGAERELREDRRGETAPPAVDEPSPGAP